MRTFAPLFALTTLLAALPAQVTVSPFRFVPADSTVVMRFAGPAKWKQKFATTQVAKLMQGQALAPMMTQLTDAFGQGMDEIRKSGKFDADLVESLLKDYAGDIVVALQLDLSNLEELMQSGETPPVGVVVALTADNSYDLGKLAAAIDKATEANAADLGTMRDLTVGAHRLRVAQQENGATTVPMLVDGQLLLLGGNDIDKFAAKVLGDGPRFAAPAGDSAMMMHVQLDSVMSTFIDAVGSQVAAMGAPFDPAEIMRDLGLGALTSLQFAVGNDGKHVTGEYTIGMKEGNRGMFDLFTGGAGAPKLLRCVPPTAETFSVMPFQANRLMEVVGKVWSALGDEVPMTWEQAQTAATESLKVRLQEDLFAHMGSELMMLDDADAATDEADEDDESPLAALNGTCIGLSLRDGKAFGESIEKMVRARGMHAARKTEEYLGTKVHKLKFAGLVDIEYAITDDVMLLGIGGKESTHRSLRSALDARASTESGLPTAAKEHTAALPEGWNGLSCTSMANTMSMLGTALAADDEMPEQAKMFSSVLTAVAADLKRLGIDRSVSASYSTPAGMTVRMRW